MEHLQKQVLTLSPEEPPRRLDALAEQGMRVCLIDGAYLPETREALRAAVLDCFQRRNDPLGLMLRVTPDMDCARLSDASEYQYILLSGFDPASAAALRARLSAPALWLAQEPEDLDQWPDLAGVLTDKPELARAARVRNLLVMTQTPGLPADARLWPQQTSPDALAEAPDPLSHWDMDELLRRVGAQMSSPGSAAGTALLSYARQSGAKAILQLTVDGSELAAVSAQYPPVPIIAVAKRPEGEAMLIRQTLRWGTLPTAIGRVPERPEAVEEFVRLVAGLYGYQPGDVIAAAGHWLASEPPGVLRCVTL